MNSQDFRSLLIQHDFSAAQQALDDGFDMEQVKDARGRGIVHWALARGDAKIAHWVLDHNPTLVIEPGETTLLALANRMNDSTVAERLLRQGGQDQLNEHDARGLTPLMRALQQRPRNEDICRTLIQEGADVRAQSSKAQDSVLMIALNEGHAGLLKDLAAHGADPNVPNAQGEVAAHVAAHALDDRLLDMFLEAFPQANLDHPANSGTPPIMRARDAEAVSKMLEAGANPNVRSANRYEECPSLLMMLAQMPDSESAVELALSKGADLSPEDLTGCTAAGHAARRGRFAILEMFYNHGLDPASPLDREGISPYHALLHMEDPMQLGMAVAMLGHYQVPVDVGCRPSPLALDKRHPSPLFLAFKQGLGSHASILLSAGARADAPGPNGVPALHALGAWAGRQEQEKLLRDRNAALIGTVKTDNSSAKEASQQRLKQANQEAEAAFDRVWQALVASQPDWNAVDAKGRTCLDPVAQADQAEFGLRLIRAGVSPVLPDPEGFSAMDRAVFSGAVRSLHAWQGALDRMEKPWSPDVGQLVLASPDGGQERQVYLRGLEALSQMAEWRTWVNARDEQGNTPLILAAATRQDDVVRFLLTHGADASLANAAGETALHHAVAQYAQETIEHLRAAGASVVHVDRLGQTPQSMGGANSQLRTSLDKPQPMEAHWRETEALMEEVEAGRALAVAHVPTAPRRRRPQV